MNIKVLLAGLFLIFFGIAAFAVYDYKVKPELDAGKIYREADLTAARGGKDAYNSAIQMHIKIMASYPQTKYMIKSYIALSDLYEKMGLYRNAYINYNYIMKKYAAKLSSSQRQDITARLGALKLKQYRTEEGMNQLYTILNQSQDNFLRSRVYSEIGYGWMKYGDMRKAMEGFNLSLYENPNNEESMLGKARVSVRNGDYEEAFEIYAHFLRYRGQVSPYADDVRRAFLEQSYGYGIQSYRKGRYSSALYSFSVVMNNFSGSKLCENAQYYSGESYYRTGQYRKAVSSFTAVLSNGLAGKDEDARIKRGFAYFSLKEYSRAVKDFDSYLEEYPRGRFVSSAAKWKDEALREISQKERVDQLPGVPAQEKNTEENPLTQDKKVSFAGDLREGSEAVENSEDASDSEVSGSGETDEDGLDDITEL